MSLLSDDPELLELARRVTTATGSPELGGIAVFLHGYRRTTEDIDLHTPDPKATSETLEGLGAVWDGDAEEHRLEGVPIHLVTDVDTVGGLATTVFGHIPKVGETVSYQGFTIEVVDAERKRVNRLRFRRIPEDSDS